MKFTFFLKTVLFWTLPFLRAGIRFVEIFRRNFCYFRCFSLLFFISLLVCGCSAPEKAPANPIWAMWHIPKSPVPLRISFTPDGRVVGIMGMNNFFAPVRYLPGGRLEIYSFAFSQRGEEPAFSRKFFQALRSAGYSVVQGNKLILFDRDRKKVMTLERFM